MPVDKCFFSDFGADATIAGNACRVIFDNAFLASLGIGASNPTALVDASTLPPISQGDAIIIQPGKFSGAFNGTVASLEPDGTGLTVLELEQA